MGNLTDRSLPTVRTTFLCLLCAALLLAGLASCRSSKPSRSAAPPSPGRAGSYTRAGGSNAKAAYQKAETVIQTARSYLGTPYRYGGTTRKGMDCSGLLVTSFKTASLTLPRTSGEQARFGKAVKTTEVRPGDLLFFAEKKGGNKVSHVGLVTTVRSRDEIRFIHSTVHGGVMEDALSSEHYRKIFIKATRPF